MAAVRGLAVLAVVFVSINAQGPTAPTSGAVASTGQTGVVTAPAQTGGVPNAASMPNTVGAPSYNQMQMPSYPYYNPYASNQYGNAYNPYGFDPMASYGGQPRQYGYNMGYNQGYDQGHTNQPEQNSFNQFLPYFALGGDTARQMALISSLGKGQSQSFFPMYAAAGGLGDTVQQAALWGSLSGQGFGGMGKLPVWALASGNDNLLPLVLSSFGQERQGQRGRRQGGYQGGYQPQAQSQSANLFQNPAWYMMLGGGL